jgi:dTDP-4-amino-4,6-dideoxygalactose transaminase
MMHPYDIVAELEKRVAEYAGAPFAVAVDSCTNAILLSLKYFFHESGVVPVGLPCRTYVGVAYAVKNAGSYCTFKDYTWSGAYQLEGTPVIDSARRFRKGMYVPGSLYCLSAHWGKHLKIGRGGFILTDNPDAYRALQKMRFDGRTAKVAPAFDHFELPGFHCYQLPEEAARGLMLMNYMPDHNDDLPWDEYPDLSKFEVFRR